MKIVMGNFQAATVEASATTISRAANDPVPSCNFSIYDSGASLQAMAYQEVIVIDDKVIANPTINLLYNSTLNPYNNAGNWTIGTVPSGVTLSQNTGGGVKATFSNTAVGSGYLQQIQPITGGQTYAFSITIAATSPVNIAASLQITWLDTAQNTLSSISGNTISPGAPQVYSLSGAAPMSAVYCQVTFYYTATNSTNSGFITYTNAQLEPQWFPSQSYPTPFCGPLQTSCRQLPLGQWIRQYRKFAGLVTSADYGGYIGNNRTIQVTASGYAWLLGAIYSNKSYSSQYDSAIFVDLLTTYLVATIYTGSAFSTASMCDTTGIIQGVQLSSFPIPWDDLRTVFNNIASEIGWNWGIGDYWDASYAPPGYTSAGIGLICDGSGTPDNITTFPAYNFHAKMDATQPGSNIIVLGNGSNTAQVIDPAQINDIGTRSGYILPTTTSWMRKVNESSLNSVTDCTQRGVAELLQYDYERYIYTLTTDNVELIAGQAIQVTSVTENLSNTTLLIQQVSATWQGKSELLADVWEYSATLGAINRQVASIMSRLFRSTNSNSSAVAIASTSLVLFERIGVQDAYLSVAADTGYQATILADNPLAYYRLNELLGTVADDYSGNARHGTINGGVTLGAAGLLSDTGTLNVNSAMSFDGSSGYIALPTSLIPTGSGHAWSIECWCKLSAIPAVNYHSMAAMGTNSPHHAAYIAVHVPSAGTGYFISGVFGFNDVESASPILVGTIYHVVGTYDGTSVRLYVNGSLAAGPTAFSDSLIANYASIGGDWGGVDLLGAVIDEVAFYDYALSTTLISLHYTTGTTTTSDYASVVLSSAPKAYYRLSDTLGSTAKDSSGHGYNGTISGGVTLGVPGLLQTAGDKAMTFNGSTGYISLPTSFVPTGAHAWSLECWCKFASIPAVGYYTMVAMGKRANQQGAYIALHVTSANNGVFIVGTFNGDAEATTIIAAGAIYHVAGTYDGTNIRLYVNGFLAAGPAAYTENIVADYASIGADGATPTDWCPATIDEAVYYGSALSATQALNHYMAGTGGLMEFDTGARGSAQSSGWGPNATDGNTWTIATIANSKTSTTQLQLFNNAENIGVIGTANSLDCTVQARINISNSGDVPSIMLRYTDSQNLIKLDFSSGVLRLRKRISNTNTNIATANVTMNTGTEYWFKFQISGTTYRGKYWQDGASEPVSWTLSATASDSILSNGKWGVQSVPASSSSVFYDNFTVSA